LLSELRDKLTKRITIQVDLQSLNDSFMNKMEEILGENKEKTERQNCKLNFEILDRTEQLKLELPSKSLKINPNNEFLEQLKKLDIVNYYLN
jgi:DNA polymerase-3 subunit alpha